MTAEPGGPAPGPQLTPRNCVFDCNILFQAMVSSGGPAAAIVTKARDGIVRLFISAYLLDELLDLATRPKLQSQFGISVEQMGAFLQDVRSFSTYVDRVADVYAHPIDPDDSHYVNLAIATNSELIVSRDRHLLNLMDESRPEGRDFHTRFPLIRVLPARGAVVGTAVTSADMAARAASHLR
jgi:putative PIN family toxin of toxin-antitoxin system